MRIQSTPWDLACSIELGDPIMHTPSARPSKTDPTGISCIVPFASHADKTGASSVSMHMDFYIGVSDLTTYSCFIT